MASSTSASHTAGVWRLSRGRAVTWLLLVLLAGGTIGSFWNLYRREAELSHAYPLQGTALQVLTLEEFRKLYSDEIVGRLISNGIEVAHDYKNKDHVLPLPATMTMELGERISKSRPGAHVRLYSQYPFPSRRDGGPRDDFERKAIAALERTPGQPFYRFEQFEGRPSLRYAVADRMQASCVQCHNSHPESPKRDWKVGDMRGVLEFIRPLDNEVAAGQLAPPDRSVDHHHHGRPGISRPGNPVSPSAASRDVTEHERIAGPRRFGCRTG